MKEGMKGKEGRKERRMERRKDHRPSSSGRGIPRNRIVRPIAQAWALKVHIFATSISRRDTWREHGIPLHMLQMHLELAFGNVRFSTTWKALKQRLGASVPFRYSGCCSRSAPG